MEFKQHDKEYIEIYRPIYQWGIKNGMNIVDSGVMAVRLTDAIFESLEKQNQGINIYVKENVPEKRKLYE